MLECFLMAITRKKRQEQPTFLVSRYTFFRKKKKKKKTPQHKNFCCPFIFELGANHNKKKDTRKIHISILYIHLLKKKKKKKNRTATIIFGLPVQFGIGA